MCSQVLLLVNVTMFIFCSVYLQLIKYVLKGQNTVGVENGLGLMQNATSVEQLIFFRTIDKQTNHHENNIPLAEVIILSTYNTNMMLNVYRFQRILDTETGKQTTNPWNILKRESKGLPRSMEKSLKLSRSCQN